MSLGIVGIDHVQIAVPRALESECLKFYREILAFSEVEKPPTLKARGGAWFQVGSIQLHVGIDPERSPQSRRHVCFLTADVEAAKAAIRARNVPVEEDGIAEGLDSFFVRDPADNRIEIGQKKSGGS